MKQRIHFIGIGGIGVSALAKYYLAKGRSGSDDPSGSKRYEISGCDLARSEITDQLKSMGVKVRIGPPKKSCVPTNVAKIIYSPAVKKEVLKIENWKLKIPVLSYPQALGELTKQYYTIAVSGTHGKSTTTAMLGLLLAKAGLNPTVIVGTKVKEFRNSNFRMGGIPDNRYPPSPRLRRAGKILVIEADEHFASFLNYWPKIIVLTTIEADHLDYWKTLKNLLKGFKQYTTHIPQDGTLVVNKDDRNIQKILNPKYKIQKYSSEQPEAKKLRKILKIPGEHNVSNALAALAVARILGIKDTTSFKALGQFHGTWRRFEIFDLKIGNCKLKIVSDYGHHPTEVKVTVQAAREKWPASSAGRPGKKIWLIFQPHQYQRTYYLWKNFIRVLSTLPVEKLILTDIYDVAGREETSIKKKVSSEKLVKAIENCKLKIANYPVVYISTLSAIESYLKQNLKGGEVVMVMGAGDIYNLTLRLCSGQALALTRKHLKGKIQA